MSQPRANLNFLFIRFENNPTTNSHLYFHFLRDVFLSCNFPQIFLTRSKAKQEQEREKLK